MSFNFGASKTGSGFPSSTTTTSVDPPQFGGGGGDIKTTQATTPGKYLGLFSAPSSGGLPLGGTTAPTLGVVPSTGGLTLGGNTAASTAPPINFNLGATATPTAAPLTFNLGSSLPTTTTAAASIVPQSLGITATTSAAPLNFPLGVSTATPATSGSTAPAFALPTISSTTTTTASTGLSFGTLGSTTTTAPASTATPAISLGLGGLVGTTVTSVATPATTTATALSSTSTLSFGQLEDVINKWTIDLEEQGKLFGNQAKQLNAWDRLLISNGEKILNLKHGIEKVKQQQQQLDQELDFVLAQQKELEDCIVPLEKELQDIPVSDVDRGYTYQLAENLDAQLKQMSEDLKEVIEHLNESNKAQESSDPMTQIGRILNAHMNSLQWVDRNTAQITSHLDQIGKLYDMKKEKP